VEIWIFILFLAWLNVMYFNDVIKQLNVMTLLIVAVFAFAVFPVIAAESSLPGDQPLINPQLERKEIIDAKIDTEDFEVGVFGGMFSTEDFGANTVVGLRIAYHITEDFFVEIAGAQTETSKSTVEELGFFTQLADDDRTLTYYNISLGYNVLPGEAFITADWAFYTAFYLIGGVGNTQFGGEDLFTINGGAGFRFIVTDWMAVHVDFRDHIFDTDFFVKKKTHNLEMHTGITFFF